MTIDRMTLKALLEKWSDDKLLREMIGFMANRMMELDVEGLTGERSAGCEGHAWASRQGTRYDRQAREEARHELFWNVPIAAKAASRSHKSKSGMKEEVDSFASMFDGPPPARWRALREARKKSGSARSTQRRAQAQRRAHKSDRLPLLAPAFCQLATGISKHLDCSIMA